MGSSSSHIEYAPTVTTSKGDVRGKTFRINDDQVVDAYLGIPYAMPPVEERRFKKPEAMEAWPNILDCVQFGPRCPQSDQFCAQYLNIVGKDEARCLNLNVIAPRWRKQEWSSGFPVIVWIHGGGFAIHSSSNYGDITVARNLCVKDVVFVSMNYRLGLFGFFNTATKECQGNMGLWDQTMALEWVRDNIDRFGGDPNNVTICGQSAGGVSVDLLSLSPHSRDLFHRVIPMAGNGLCDYGIRPKDVLAEVCAKYAQFIGWKGDDDEELLEWLRSQPTSKLEVGLAPIKGFECSEAGPIYFVPNFDGDFFPKLPSELRKEMPKKSVLTGTTQWEGLLVAVVSFLPRSFEGIRKICEMKYKEIDYGEDTATVRSDIIDFYTKDIDRKDKKAATKKLVELLGDYGNNNPTFNYANQMASSGHHVYFYSFEYCNPNGYGILGWLMPFIGATHCSELRYILGKGIISKFKPNKDDLKMIDKMTSFWSNFAKYGNPNGPDGPNDWVPHSIDNPYRHMRIQLNDGGMADNYQNRRADFWNENIIPKNKTRARL